MAKKATDKSEYVTGDPRLEKWQDLEFAPALAQYQGGVTTGILTYCYDKTFNEAGEPVTRKVVDKIKTLTIKLDGQGRGYKPETLEEAEQLLEKADKNNNEEAIVLYENREAPKAIRSLEAENRALKAQLEAKDARMAALEAEVFGKKES